MSRFILLAFLRIREPRLVHHLREHPSGINFRSVIEDRARIDQARKTREEKVSRDLAESISGIANAATNSCYSHQLRIKAA